MTSRALSAAEILEGHVSLGIECLDRIYLNGYVPNLQVSGQVVGFLSFAGGRLPRRSIASPFRGQCGSVA